MPIAAVLCALVPALPTPQEEAATAAERPPTPGLTSHAAPRPLAEGAVTEDWPSFLGPRRDGICRETPLRSDFGSTAPALVWELERGDGFASPAVADGRLVFTHRVGREVHVDCHEALTGERVWRHSFPCDYSGRYFDHNGPRATPTIADGRVVVHGVGGLLVVLDFEDGRELWSFDSKEVLEVGDDFFGVVSSPLVVDDMVVQNFGAPGGPSVAALDLETGDPRWLAGSEWGPSCASPVLATIAGEPRILVIAAGESRPPVGGLMIISPEGEVTTRYPFRSRTTLSVNGPSPVPMGDSVFLTAAYNVGSAVLDVDKEGRGVERWRDRRSLALEFATPIFTDGLIIAVDGVSGRAGALVAIDPKDGKERARTALTFDQEIGSGDRKRTLSTSLGKGAVMEADGVFWALGDTGQLVTARLGEDDFEVISQAPLFYAAETWTPPVICNGLLYVCQNNPGRVDGSARRLLCYDVRGE